MSDARRDSTAQQVRAARGKFAAMAGTYSLGVLNDNVFKQAACLLAVYVGKPHLQDTAVVVFTLPWLLFAAWAGWAADRFAKRHVVIVAKGLELAAMLCGGLGIIFVNWPLVMVMMFLMALQSTLFSPAINGSIPELFPGEYVFRANSRLKSMIMAGNLVGIILAGVILDIDRPVAGIELGRWIIGVGVVVIALVGVLMSLGVARKPAADPQARFPRVGPLQTLRELWQLRRDPLLATVVVADAFMWFVA
ncbi:MAG: MFS transporter, partial [Phycisphaerae bacterium]|nr:MFS transporter [Phycisphaerae bacterium]